VHARASAWSLLELTRARRRSAAVSAWQRMRSSQATALGVGLIACVAFGACTTLMLHYHALASVQVTFEHDRGPKEIRLLAEAIARSNDPADKAVGTGPHPLAAGALHLHVCTAPRAQGGYAAPENVVLSTLRDSALFAQRSDVRAHAGSACRAAPCIQ